ncbi:MAG: PHP domain-containing protein [Clostridia bacterium]|nr:PHP domain-containing protein [Clostridia bacterium]
MDIFFDSHTHSIASGHHTSDTLFSLAKSASLKGLTHLCVTDHAPKMIGAAKESYFRNLRYGQKKIFGVNVIYGVELNVLDASGKVDLSPDILNGLDFAIASLHREIFKPSNEEYNTSALINAMDNPYVSVIGHPDDPTYEINLFSLTDAAKEKKVILEVNSMGVSENGYRKHNIGWLKEMLNECKRKEIYIVLGSDSHGSENIANFSDSIKLLNSIEFPEKLILNGDPQKFLFLAAERRKDKNIIRF